MDGWLMRDVLLFALGVWIATMGLVRLMTRQRDRSLREIGAEIEQQRRAKVVQDNSKQGK